jgi:uncharacterized membrane protein YqjE
MPEPKSEDVHRTGEYGFFAHLAGLIAAKLAYLRARLELAGIEAREATIHYSIILGLAIGALIVLVFGYLFLVIALVFLVAALLGTAHAWIWVLLGAALLHLLGAAILGWIAKLKLSAPMFTASLNELKKDQEWLKTTAKQN